MNPTAMKCVAAASAAVLVLTLCAAGRAADARPAYLDPEQPTERRVADLLSRMTLEEKVSQMTFKSPPIERLNVPGAYWWNQCLSEVVRP